MLSSGYWERKKKKGGGGSDLGLTIDVLGKDADVTSAQLCTMEIIASRKKLYIFRAYPFNELKKKQKQCPWNRSQVTLFRTITEYHALFPTVIILSSARYN
jgi:hypothetical protein